MVSPRSQNGNSACRSPSVTGWDQQLKNVGTERLTKRHGIQELGGVVRERRVSVVCLRWPRAESGGGDRGDIGLRGCTCTKAYNVRFLQTYISKIPSLRRTTHAVPCSGGIELSNTTDQHRKTNFDRFRKHRKTRQPQTSQVIRYQIQARETSQIVQQKKPSPNARSTNIAKVSNTTITHYPFHSQ
jgi:hypothetical protein